jgi:flagellar protein FliS
MSAAAANPANAYLRTKVLTATPEELRLMLLDGAIKFACQGREGLSTRNYELSFTGISQCRDIVLELITSIKPEVDPELAGRIRAVYTFMYTTLVEASMEKSVPKVEQVIKLLEYERETWALLLQKLADERAAGTIRTEPGTPAEPTRAVFSVEA